VNSNFVLPAISLSRVTPSAPFSTPVIGWATKEGLFSFADQLMEAFA